jgi:hypothetical protein
MTMKWNEEAEERLWNWLDGQASEQEAALLQELVAADADWKSNYEKLKSLHEGLKTDMEWLQPSMRFTKNVMEQIAAISMQAVVRKNYVNKKIVWAVGGILVCMLVAVLAYAFASVSYTDTSNVDLQWPNFSIKSINWAKWWNGPVGLGAMMLFVISGLHFADQYFRQKLARPKQDQTG